MHWILTEPWCVFPSRPGEDQAKVKPHEPTDAAGLIAEALKRKFAHRYGNGQEDKEDFRLPVPEVKPQTEAPLVRNELLSLLCDVGTNLKHFVCFRFF